VQKPNKKSKKKQNIENTLLFACLFLAIKLIADLYFFETPFSINVIIESIAIAVIAAIPYHFTMSSWCKLK